MVWFPKFNSSPVSINSHSSFDFFKFSNPDKIYSSQFIDTSFLKTLKLKIYPDEKQINIIQQWFFKVILVYNHTNEYIKNTICNYKLKINSKNHVDVEYTFIDNKKEISKTLNFINLRAILKNYISTLHDKSLISRHTLDYSIKICIEMYKSLYSNYKNKKIKHFYVKDLIMNRRRLNLILEPNCFSKKHNAFCYKALQTMKSDKSFKSLKLNHNIILQYDKIKNEYYLLVPIDDTIKQTVYREKKCGIDIGVRTFMTVYSNNKCLEIGKNMCEKIDKSHEKIDKLQSHYNTNKISEGKYKKARRKYEEKIKNKIEDMHKKVCNFLLRNYEIINIGKVSTKNMVSNLTGNIKEKTKRRLLKLSHYKFRQYLILNAKKYKCKINEINEYMTSKTCHNCKKIKKDLGGSKIYECKKCKIKIDRDINASINIYNI